jgi:hypothetical protein
MSLISQGQLEFDIVRLLYLPFATLRKNRFQSFNCRYLPYFGLYLDTLTMMNFMPSLIPPFLIYFFRIINSF